MDEAQSPRCWSCGSAIEAKDLYCRRCGSGQGERIAWYYRPWGIFLCTLLGLGPFGLALVWRSPLLKTRARWIWTLAILLAAGFIVWQAFRAVAAMAQLLPEILRLSGQL